MLLMKMSLEDGFGMPEGGLFIPDVTDDDLLSAKEFEKLGAKRRKAEAKAEKDAAAERQKKEAREQRERDRVEKENNIPRKIRYSSSGRTRRKRCDIVIYSLIGLTKLFTTIKF